MLALTEDFKKPININSINQSLDLQKNIAYFTGKVTITQGSTKISADKVVVIRQNNDNNNIIFKAYGNPATFYRMQNNGDLIQGQAETVYYELKYHFVKLTGNAFIQQKDSNIKGYRIIYMIREHKIRVYSKNKKEQVITVLTPSQLQHIQHRKVHLNH